MNPKNRFSATERAARSRITQLLHNHEFICGSLVSMERCCGKKNCRCQQGEKHVSLYLSINLDGKRHMIYIPSDLEEQTRRQVDVWRESNNLAHALSNACVQRLIAQKRNSKNNG
jgi:hypothetical protein